MRYKTIYPFLDSENIYNKIDEIRQVKGLSIYEMTKSAGVSSASVYKWRDRKSSPSLYLIESLCDNLFIKNEELVHLQDSEKELLDTWRTLSANQKLFVINLIKSYTKK